MDGGSQRLVAAAAHIDFVDLAGLVADRSGPGQSLQSAGLIKAGAVGANFTQQAWGDLRTGSRQRTEELVIGVFSEELLDLGTVGLDLGLEHPQHRVRASARRLLVRVSASVATNSFARAKISRRLP